MLLLGHILAKDLRRLAPTVAAYLSLLAAKIVVLFAIMADERFAARGLKHIPAMILEHAVEWLRENLVVEPLPLLLPLVVMAYAEHACLALLVILALRQDAPARTPAFWRTLPVTGWLVAGEKLLLIVLLAWLVPFGLLTMASLLAGVEPRHWWAGGVSLATENALWCGYAMLAGVVCRHVWTAFLLALLLRLIVALNLLIVSLTKGTIEMGNEQWLGDAERVSAVVVLLVGLGLLFWAYARRHAGSGRRRGKEPA